MIGLNILKAFMVINFEKQAQRNKAPSPIVLCPQYPPSSIVFFLINLNLLACTITGRPSSLHCTPWSGT